MRGAPVYLNNRRDRYNVDIQIGVTVPPAQKNLPFLRFIPLDQSPIGENQ